MKVRKENETHTPAKATMVRGETVPKNKKKIATIAAEKKIARDEGKGKGKGLSSKKGKMGYSDDYYGCQTSLINTVLERFIITTPRRLVPCLPLLLIRLTFAILLRALVYLYVLFRFKSSHNRQRE